MLGRLFGRLFRKKRAAAGPPSPPALEICQILTHRPSDFLSVAWSPDGHCLAAGATDGCVWLFDLRTGESRLLEGHEGEVLSVAWSPDGCALASGSDDSTVRLWDITTGETSRVLTGHAGAVFSVAWSPDGNMLASGSASGTIRLWDPITGGIHRVLEGCAGTVYAVAWAPKGRILASGSADRAVRLWDPATGMIDRVLEGHEGAVYTVAWSPDGCTAASGAWDRAVILWNLSTGLILRRLNYHVEPVRSVAWTPDGRSLASGSDDQTICVWSPAADRPRATLTDHGDSVRCVAWSPDGGTLASGSAGCTVRLWDSATCKLSRTLEGHRGDVLCAAYSPDGRLLASGSADGSVRLWDLVKGQPPKLLEGPASHVHSLAWSPDGCVLAWGSHDQTIRLWDLTSPRTYRALEGHTGSVESLAWSPDGATLASGSADRIIRLWLLASPDICRTLRGHTDSVESLAWSPDGGMLASGSADRTMRLWDWRTGDAKQPLEGHATPVCALAWSRDGTFLASAATNCEVALWKVSDGQLLVALERLSYRCRPLALSFGGPPKLPDRLGEAEIRRRYWRVVPDEPPVTRVAPAVAKVALVGDASVGKSCLALRLAEDRFEDQAPTHGMRIWTLLAQRLHEEAAPPPGQQREVLLWDLAGAADSQLAHQLFLRDITTALVLFDATRGEPGYAAVEDWSRRLDLQARGRKLNKILVRTKLDLGGTADGRRVEELLRDCGFAGYHELSARTGEGIDALREHLSAALPWDSTVRFSRPALYHMIRQTLQEERTQTAVLSHSDLKKRLQKRAPMCPEQDLDTALSRLALEGYLADLQLAGGGRVLLLRPDAVAQYASSLILAARTHSRGVPLIELRGILSPQISLPGIEDSQRLDGSAERAVLECLVQLFLERGLCLEHAGALVFPTLFSPAPVTEGETVLNRWPLCYEFCGPIDNIYASVVARLAATGEFGGVRLWADRAEYEQSAKGVFGIKRADRAAGKGRLEFYFSGDPDPGRRDLFIRFVEDHLSGEVQEVQERLGFDCECGFQFDDPLLRRRLVLHQDDIQCPSCQKTYPLPRAPAESQELADQVRTLKTRAEEQTRQVVEQAKATMVLSTKEAPTDAPVRILHLSDLHLTRNCPLEHLLDPLQADLREMGVQKLDYLVVCGDLAERCDPAGLSEAEEFLKALIARFDLSADRLVLVPGNHEVDRDERLGPFRRCYKNLKQADYPEPYELQGVVIRYPETHIEFLTLNSAWETDRSYPNRTSIHTGALSKALSDTNPEIKLRIVVWHHPVTLASTVAKPEQIRALIRAGYRLCLHGDVHKRGNGFLERLGPLRRLHVLGAGSFPSPDLSIPQPGPLLYNLLEVERDFSRIRVRSRAQQTAGGPFEFYSLYPASDDPELRRGDYRISLMPDPHVTQLVSARAELDRLIRVPEGPIEAWGIYIAHRRLESAVYSADFYGVVRRDDGSLGICFVDVESHGLAAALHALTVARLLLRPELHWGHGRPHQELEAADQRIAEELADRATAVTMSFTEIDPRAKKVRFANAGMPPALLFHAGRPEPEVLQAVGIYVGAGYRQHSNGPKEAEADFEKGDILTLYSDGISEARDQKGRLFGEAGVCGAVRRAERAYPEAIADEILNAVRAHTGRQYPDDDQAVLVIGFGAQPQLSGTGSVEEFRLSNRLDAPSLCDEKLKPRVLAWAARPGQRTRQEPLCVWAGVWEATLNALRFGSKPGDEILIRFTASTDRTLVVEIEQPLVWADSSAYLVGPISEPNSEPPFGGTIIMRRSTSDNVKLTLGGRCVELRYPLSDAPDQVNA